jgi:hypothetical protein
LGWADILLEGGVRLRWGLLWFVTACGFEMQPAAIGFICRQQNGRFLKRRKKKMK